MLFFQGSPYLRPIAHQTYKDRLDESQGMRRRYGEPGAPVVTPPVVSPSPPTSPPTTSVNFPQFGGGYDYLRDPTITASTYGEPGAPYYEGPITGPVVSTGAGTGYSSDPNAAVAAAVGGGSPQLGAGRAEPGGVSSHPSSADEIIADAVAAAVGGGTTGTGTGPVDAGGFPANPYVGQVYIDANHVTWTFAQGQWNRVDLASEGPGTGGPGT